MIPTSFNYKRANSIDDALASLGEDCKLLAGGHSLIPAMKLRLNQPALLIDITQLQELRGICDGGDYVGIGATTTHGDIAKSELVKSACAMVVQGAEMIGDRQVRNVGTIGGSIAHADPAADWPGILIGANASFILRNQNGQREVAASDFFVGFYETLLAENEMITEIRIPKGSEGTISTYLKFVQPASRFAIVGCAISIKKDNGTIAEARVAFTGVSDVAFLDTDVIDALVGKPATKATIDQAVAKAIQNRDILSDHYASEEYRSHLAKVYLRKGLEKLIG